MMNPLGNLKALYSFLTLSIQSKVPSLKAMRGLSQMLAIGAILGIIIVGGVVIYIVVSSSGPTSSTYP